MNTTVTAMSTRPAGKPGECFYCNQAIGQDHELECVMLQKVVKVRYTYELEIEVPAHWDKDMIEFARNESSWCADNSIDELRDSIKSDACICGRFHCNYIEDGEMLGESSG